MDRDTIKTRLKRSHLNVPMTANFEILSLKNRVVCPSIIYNPPENVKLKIM